MAYFHLLFLTLSLSTTTTTTATTTATLHVTAAIQTTINLLNPTSFHQQAITTQPQNTSSLSFTLHPRSTIHHHDYDYESLTHARLARDSHRVTSLTTKLNFAITGTNKSDIKPNMRFKFPEDLVSPVTSGMFQGSGEYFARVGLGTPTRFYYLVIDTGSDVNWLQCKPCKECYKQTDPIFDPEESSSYYELPCNTQQCEAVDITACQSNDCVYQVKYGDGSFSVGKLITETVSFGNTASLPMVAVGCGNRNQGLFVGSAGLLALGGGLLSLPSQLKATSFSYCFVNRDSKSSSTLEFNTAAPTNSVTAPLLRNPRMKTYLYVGLAGISVAARPVFIPPSIFTVDDTGRGGVIVDSGTSVSHLQLPAYNALRDAFVTRANRNLKRTSGFSIFDACYDLSATKHVPVPKVAFIFAGGKTLVLKPENYMIPVDSHGKFCLAFAPSDSPVSIIGNVQQQGTRVSFDVGKSVIGFSPHSC